MDGLSNIIQSGVTGVSVEVQDNADDVLAADGFLHVSECFSKTTKFENICMKILS